LGIFVANDIGTIALIFKYYCIGWDCASFQSA